MSERIIPKWCGVEDATGADSYSDFGVRISDSLVSLGLFQDSCQRFSPALWVTNCQQFRWFCLFCWKR